MPHSRLLRGLPEVSCNATQTHGRQSSCVTEATAAESALCVQSMGWSVACAATVTLVVTLVVVDIIVVDRCSARSLWLSGQHPYCASAAVSDSCCVQCGSQSTLTVQQRVSGSGRSLPTLHTPHSILRTPHSHSHRAIGTQRLTHCALTDLCASLSLVR